MICPHCDKPIKTTKITPKQRAKVIDLMVGGYSCRDVQKIMGVSFSSAARIWREHKAKGPG
jgi:transposase